MLVRTKEHQCYVQQSHGCKTDPSRFSTVQEWLNVVTAVDYTAIQGFSVCLQLLVQRVKYLEFVLDVMIFDDWYPHEKNKPKRHNKKTKSSFVCRIARQTLVIPVK